VLNTTRDEVNYDGARSAGALIAARRGSMCQASDWPFIVSVDGQEIRALAPRSSCATMTPRVFRSLWSKDGSASPTARNDEAPSQAQQSSRRATTLISRNHPDR